MHPPPPTYLPPPLYDLPCVQRYTTRIEADEANYPVLLGNGNLKETGKLEGGRWGSDLGGGPARRCGLGEVPYLEIAITSPPTATTTASPYNHSITTTSATRYGAAVTFSLKTAASHFGPCTWISSVSHLVLLIIENSPPPSCLAVPSEGTMQCGMTPSRSPVTCSHWWRASWP